MKLLKRSLTTFLVAQLLISCNASSSKGSNESNSNPPPPTVVEEPDNSKYNANESYEIKEKGNQKPNDILVAVIYTSDISIEKIDKSEFSHENTQLLTKQEYRESKFIKKKFTSPSGTFDENQFSAAYEKATYYYSVMATNNNELATRLEKYVEYNTDSRFRPIGGRTR